MNGPLWRRDGNGYIRAAWVLEIETPEGLPPPTVRVIADSLGVFVRSEGGDEVPIANVALCCEGDVEELVDAIRAAWEAHRLIVAGAEVPS